MFGLEDCFHAKSVNPSFLKNTEAYPYKIYKEPSLFRGFTTKKSYFYEPPPMITHTPYESIGGVEGGGEGISGSLIIDDLVG